MPRIVTAVTRRRLARFPINRRIQVVAQRETHNFAQRTEIAWLRTRDQSKKITRRVHRPVVVRRVADGILPAKRNPYVIRIMAQLDSQIPPRWLPSWVADLHGLLKRQSIFVDDRPMQKSFPHSDAVFCREPPMVVEFALECFFPAGQCHQNRKWQIDGTFKFAGPSRDEKGLGKTVYILGKGNDKVRDIELRCVFWRKHPLAPNRADPPGG